MPNGPSVFGDDEKLTTALLDRLADRATVIVTKGRSYRMRRRQTQPDPQAAAETGEETKPKKRQRNRPGAWLSFRAATGSVSRRAHQQPCGVMKENGFPESWGSPGLQPAPSQLHACCSTVLNT